jgi:6-pyruvoyltetrahydropterin/6-carboxytetrahydropterin synthase
MISDARSEARPLLDLYADFRFEAAHQLPGVPAEHMCGRLHGHSYWVRVTVRGRIDARAGWVMDVATLNNVVDPLRSRLDHRFLNDIEGLANPTSENLAVWIWHELASVVPLLHSIEVREMPGLGCIYRGPDSVV